MSCGNRFDERVTLWRNDKIPYGTYYAYHSLKYLFSNATIQTISKSPLSFYDNNESPSAYIIIGANVRPDEEELKAILAYAGAGNQIFISAISIGQNLLDSFRIDASHFGNVYNDADSLTLSIYNPDNYDSFSYTYPGKPMDNHFTTMDSSITNILGKDRYGRANFVKFTYKGGGALFLHLAPAAFTNFFLLHKSNKKYYDLSLSAIPDSMKNIRWDDYYRHHTNGIENGKSNFSRLSSFLKNEVLRWAFWLTLLLFAFIYLFESKRKQRPVPVIKELRNSSLDFVRTVGRLYYQRRDNKNLAAKMATHFLAYVRTRYNLQTSQLDEEFESALAFKSGAGKQTINNIIQYIRVIDEQLKISDEDLLSFNESIEKFYKQA